MKTSLIALLCAGVASADQLYFAPGNQFYDYGVEAAKQASVFDMIHHPENLHPQFAETYKPLTNVLMNQEGTLKTNDKLLDDLLISPREGYHGLMYDEAMGLMNTIAREFPEMVTMESIGRTHQDRDIWMMKINGAPHITGDNTDKKAILLTGAHHSRELVSTQMPLYTVLDLLHGYLHGDQEKTNLLTRNQYFVVPMLNTDGCWTIMDHYKQTGEMLLKRKNGDYRFEKEGQCAKMYQGVDINRNYGYIWGNNDQPCGESFPGPHPFSEPESRAMRNLLMKYQDDIKFVYNFHAYGPMWVWPYNGEIKNELAESNPLAQQVFNEIWEEAHFPTSTLHGNAMQTVGYQANGEANDYIMKAFNIPSVSPELGNDNFFSGEFFIQYDFVVREVLRDNNPWIMHTFKKLGGEVAISNVNLAGNVLAFDMVNTGLQDWNMASEGLSLELSSPQFSGIATTINLPNFTIRQGKRLEVTLEDAPAAGFEVDFKYKKFGSDTELTVDRVQVGQIASAPQASVMLI